MTYKFVDKFVKFITRSNQGSKSFTTALNIMSDPVVTVRQGKLRGAYKQLVDRTPYFSFKGIPYAQPPVGKLRFAAPLPPQPWQGTYDAIHHGPICPQYNMAARQFVEGDENCLYLNVYTKSLQRESKLPVMVFIHGGAYFSGSGNVDHGLGPEFLLQHDVVLVTMNYRLEVLGFLCLDTPEVPGNAGMKDQVFALRWVQNNIAQFGGDPDNVTVFGESAGATSVTYLMQSPMSKGLYHKAIAQSGVSLNDWAQGKDGKQRAFRVGKELGNNTNDASELLEFLRNVPTSKLARQTFNTMTVDEKHRGLPIHFAPVVEKKFHNVEPFLTREPIDALVAKEMFDVPLILGYNSVEALVMLDIALKNLKFTNANPQYLVPREIAQRISEDKIKEFGLRIRNFYVGDREFTADDGQIIADMLSDNRFVYNIHRFAHFYSAIQKSTYLYKFSFETELNLMKKLAKLSKMKGASHVDEQFYLFDGPLNKRLYEEQANLREIVFRVTKLWTDFAKTGNPTPDSSSEVKWTPYTTATRDYLDIDHDMSMGQYADRDRVEFWNKLYSEAGLPCINDPVVTVRQGKLKGAIQKLLDGTAYYSFKGVPYAQPPVGKLRFAAPLPPQPWQGTYEAIHHGPVCPQYDMIRRDYVEGNENCLFLNIYTKSLQSDSKLPVMVFIHGGAFMSGSGNSDELLGPEFLLQHDVILVTLNYRLEVLGFLCMDTPEVPGNAGMKDQVSALRWVQNNIANFGGDPNNVTLFGESAGSSSVIYHMQSPMSKGLFHKAIAQSGVNLNDWAQGKEGKQRAFRLGKVLRKDTNDSADLLEFLHSVPAIKLARLTFKTMTADEKHRGLPMHFIPVVEKKFDNVEPFLTEEPIDLLLEKKINAVPLMLGYNSVEALIMIDDALSKLDFMNANTQYLVPREIAQRIPEDRTKELGLRIRNYYTSGDKEFTEDDMEIIANMLSDTHFVYNIHRFAHFYSEIQKSTYMYKFSFESDLNVVKKISGKSDIKGASHADELFYFFHNFMNKDSYEEQDKLKEIVFRVTKLWADFAKTSNPTPDSSSEVKWTPYTTATRDYVDIDHDMAVRQYAERDRVEFWNKLYFEAGLPCITKSSL